MGLQLNDPLRLVWAILTMRETYYMVDIPLLYVRLLLLAPFALVLLHKRATWLLIVLSTGVWLVTQAFPTNDVLGWSVANNVTFHLPSWQFVFCAGMVLGYHRTWLAKLVRPSVYGRWLVATGLVFLGLICLYIAEHHVPGLFADAETGFFGKTNVGPGRLLVSAVVFTFLFLSVHSAWIPLRRSVGWLLLPLGQHALLAYTAHVLFGLLLVSLEASFGHWVTGSPLVDAALQIIAIGLIWLIIRWRVRLGQPPSVGRTTTTLGRLPGVAIHKLVPHPAVQSMGRVA